MSDSVEQSQIQQEQNEQAEKRKSKTRDRPPKKKKFLVKKGRSVDKPDWKSVQKPKKKHSDDVIKTNNDVASSNNANDITENDDVTLNNGQVGNVMFEEVDSETADSQYALSDDVSVTQQYLVSEVDDDSTFVGEEQSSYLSDGTEIEEQVSVSGEETKERDVSYLTPYMEHALKMSQTQSQVEYHKNMKRLQGQYNLDVSLPDLPEVKIAKKAGMLASSNVYRKGLEEVREKFKGFQKLEYKDSPEAKRSEKAAILSDKSYKEEWEYDKGVICFPATLTKGYDAMTSAQRNASSNVYKENLPKTLENVHFDPTKTNLYKTIQDNLKYTSSNEYKEGYEKNKHKYTPVPFTADMVRYKALNNFRNWNSYTAYARKLWEKYHLVVPIPLIAQAVETAKNTSEKWYKADYKTECVGKSGPANIVNYPLLQQARKAGGLASNIAYRKEADKAKMNYTVTTDTPDFIRAKTATDSSHNKYVKQKAKAIADFQGYQKMDPSLHPIVQRANMAAALSDNKAYHEDWEYDKQMIYYPVHITPGYEASADVKKVQSDSSYKQEFEKLKSKNRFDVTDTQNYDDIKNSVTDLKYKEQYRKNQGHVTQVAETPEMVLSKELRPIQSKKQYTEKSKDMQKNVNVGSDVQEISHAVDSQKQSSANAYKSHYKENMVGKPPNDPTTAYPEHDLHKKMTQLKSSPEYTKEASALQRTNQLPVDCPQFTQPKAAAQIASNVEYKKQKQDAIDNYRGFQTMQPENHPVVLHANRANQLNSEKAYHEDWEYDKQNVCYPVHITPGYEASADVKKVQSDAIYKKEFESLKEKNRFQPTDTEQYKELKQLHDTASNLKYREDYEKNKGKNQTNIAETHEMVLSKELRPIQSKKQYTEKSKDMQKNVNVGSDVQEIKSAVSSQQLASKLPYTKDYKQNIVGKGPINPNVSYPEHELHRKVGNLASSAEYQKDAEKMMHTHNLPLDYPEFVRAKQTAINASDRHYQKQKQEVIDNYKGFQTMDSNDHPIVQQGIKAAELASKASYIEDWEYDKQMIYYPVHITPGYEASADVKKVQSDIQYKENFEKNKDKNNFDVTSTENYKSMQENDKTKSEVKYREDYEKNKGKNQTNIPETHEMVLSKELRPIQSKKQYTEKSKDMQKNVNVGSDLQELSTAVNVQKMSSDRVYKADYDKNMVGKAPADIAKAYPEYDLLRQVSKQNSKAEYQKDAEKMMHTHNLPLDYPEFVRAKRTAINASDRHYQKQRQEVIDNYKGFQTMDSNDHPIVQQGIKAAELASKPSYIEDWEYDKQMIYYPVHITPGYEASADVKKIQSDVTYKEKFEKTKDQNRFDVTDTENYKSMKGNEMKSSYIKYREEYEKNKGKNQTNIPETHEMVLSKELRPIQSKKQYTEKSKDMQKNVNVGSDLQELSTAVNVQKMSSDRMYKADYDKNMVGKAPADIAKAYPEYDLLRQVSKQNSKAEYQKDAEKMMHTHNLPLDYPEFVRAKRTAINASDRHYQKQRQEVIDNYKGFQTMDSNDHPIVQQGIKAAELASKPSYIEDWEYDKQMIYYPVHITPGYEASADVKKVQSDVLYKENFEKSKDKNNFDVTSTENYKSMQENDKTKSEVKYREEYEKNKGKNQTNIPETHEMVLSKELRPIQSKKKYTEKSKDMQKNVNVGSDLQELSTAVNVQKMSSDRVYKADYDKNMVGKAPADIAKAYPEYDLLRQVSKQNSKAEYQKDAEKMMHTHNLPLDYPEFVRAKRTAINASDRHYQKQRQEVIDNYKGFQTMDSNDHPIVQQGIKAAELASKASYIEDWEYDKQMIYYPVHITPGYEASADVKKVQSDVQYKENFEKNKDKNNFDVTSTENYKSMQENDKTKSEVKYREDYEKNKGKNQTNIPETHEMVLSKELRPIQSKKQYTEKSKDMQKNVNVGSDLQELSTAVNVQKMSSDRVYKADYDKNMVGKAPADIAKAYPEYDLLRQVSKQNSKAEYQKDAEKMMHTHNLPLDYPEFVRAKRTAINASDRHYQKQRQEVIDNYKGFQTMDSSDHPVVQRGIKAAELMSDKLYKEDWEYIKPLVYYPVHITPGYEQAIDASKFQSQALYTKDGKATNAKNNFTFTETEQYQTAKQLLDLVSDKNYTESHIENRGKGLHPLEVTPEMALSNSLRPLLSEKAYTQDSKKIMQKYNLDSTSTQGISHALGATKATSQLGYLKDFRKNVLGKAPADIAKAYPEYDLLRQVSKQNSKAEYQKDAEKMMHTHNLPLDYPEFVRAKRTAINASDRHYQKQRQEVIDNYKGFQTMDSKVHPVVQQGIKAAELASDKAYREDWEYDKQMIYFPAHITPGYEAAMNSSKSSSNTAYTKDHEKTKASNKFNMTDTETYKTNKDVSDLVSDKKYHEAYEASKGKNPAQIKETPEMTISKSLKPLLSNKLYGDDARRKMKEYNLDTSMQAIAQALSVQKLADNQLYTKDFRKNVVGAAPADITMSYPEYEHARNVSKLTSKALYWKDAEKMMHTHNLPLDYPEFVRAKQNAKNASDAEYRKQRKEVIDKYRGFQTMDSDNHPIVQQGIKAADLLSERKYKEDYMADKDIIYYPVHLTPGYESAMKAGEIQSETTYKKKHNKEDSKNNYQFTDTESYIGKKNLDVLKDHVYKGEYPRNFTAIPITPEMEASNLVKGLLSQATYTKEAKKRLDVYNVDLNDQRVAHALGASKISSDNLYTKKFKKDILGKSPHDVTIAHPEYELARQVSKMNSKSEYVKEADKMMHHHNIPLDYPEFIRARECAKNASDAEYRKQRKEVIDKYRGFQTMDSDNHPIVQQGIKAADLISHHKYIEDYMIDRNIIYYPVHLTPGYEAATKASQYQSDLKYKEGYNKMKGDLRFDPTTTDQYKNVKSNQGLLNDDLYKASGKELKFSAIEQTPEMQIAKTLKPLKPSEYQKTAKDLLQKYHLNVELPEITHAVCVTQLQSRNKYLEDYNKNIKGSAPSDLVNSYPEYIHARNVSKNTSKAEYTKTGEEMRHHFTIPLDTPELTRAKEAAKNASDQLYKKQRKEVIDSYRGFQTMDSKNHPIVQQGIKAAEMMSDKKYKEDYMDERDMIYFPVHLTPGYEAASKSSDLQSDVKYTEKHKKEKALNKFNPVQTDSYEQTKAQQTALMDKNYKKGVEELSFTPIADSIDQAHLKEMRKLMNNKKYTDDAKKTLDKYNINADVIQIAHALVTTPLSSDTQYRKDYQAEVKGKGVSAAGIEFYPDYVKAKDNTKLASKSEYSKENEKMVHHYTMPVDTPDLNRAKESAINASDLHYKKQRKEVIDSYRGFQTMDSKNHPIVQQGIKAADLMSERKYKEDYMEDRNIIYYPVHLTPGYESATKASQYINGPSYKKAYNKTRNDFQYDVTKTEGYANTKDLEKLSDNSYKTDPSSIPFTQNKDGPDMERARMVKPLVSYWFYKDQAKKMLDKYHLDLSDQRMVQAIQSNKLTSEIKYRKDYEKDVKGKMKNESIEAYPEYKHAQEVSKHTSKNAYTKESAKDMNNYTIPADHPFITHAKQVDENVSQIAYTKQRQDVIDKFRGFQTMDSKNHPIVQRGIKAADLISERKYKEDYMEDRNLIYYPVHLTAGYEAATKSSKFASDADYKKWYNKNIKGCGNFPANLSRGYDVNKQAQQLLSNNAYKKKYEESKSEFTSIPNIIEMRNVKEVQPLLSQKKYKSEAQALMNKYHLDAGVPEIAHALFVTSVLSPAIYKKKYEEDVKGKGAEHLEKSPYIQQMLKASKLASKAGYGRKAQEDMHLYRLGLDTAEIQQALIADKLTSDITYKKGAAEAKEDCKGYFKLPTDQIPTYKHLKKVADNMSDIKYHEEYNDMKKYVYFPYHITPQYEKQLEASKLLNHALYAKNHKESMAKSNFKYHEIPGYLANKALQSMMDVHKDKKAMEELHQHGYNNSKDVQGEHILAVQKRLSNNLYKAAAREVMDKYNITAELPEIKQALIASKLASHNKYKEGYETGKGMTYDPAIPSFQLARNVKALNSENLYKNEANQALHTYQVVPDAPDITHAKSVTQNASDVEYKKRGTEILSKVKGYQHLKASEQRDVAHARKVNDIFSPAKYKEEYNEIRNLIYFPVHLTDGYECAIKANKFASPANYKRDFYKSRFFNRYKVHETEGYQLDRAVQQMISNITYRAAYNKEMGKCPYITETPQRGHHRDMKNLFSENRYRNDAKGIMSKYDLITDEPRMLNAIKAVKLASENTYKEDYEKNKGKPTHNIHETPVMKRAMLSSKLASEKPYKQAALKELQSVRMPEDTTTIKHAQQVGVMMSDIVYKKDAKENRLQGYNKVSMKDNYVLRHLDGIKDIASEVHYKQDLFDQRGQSIPVVDTPENVRLQKQQKLQSDKLYKKDVEKHIKGRGLSTDKTPQIEHAKDMAVLFSETKYKEGTKDLHEWKSGEAINTPTAVKAKQTNDLTSDYKYREEYEKNKGQGCNVITPAIVHAKDVTKNVSDISYKEKHVEDGLTPPSFTVLPSTPRIQHVQEVGRNQSEIKYREQHNKEDIGKSAELKDSVLIKSNVKTSELQSNIEYRKQGHKVVEDYKAYFNCINDTPPVKHARKAKDILSTFKYKEAYENEKGIFFYPYFLTPQYEAQVKAGKLQSQTVYKKKAENEKHIYHLTTDQPNFRHAREALDLCSDLKYRQPYQGKAAKLKDSRDIPSILHSKKMQELLSDKKYKSKYEDIKDKYHLDVVTPTMANAKNANKIISDVSYKKQHNKEKGNAYNAIQDSLEMKHLRSLPEQFSDNKYKQDLIVSRGKVIQVADTPWLTGYKQAQQFISHIKYGQNSGKKLKCRYQPDKFNKHVKNVTENISDSKYHDDYEQYFKGNLIPLPLTPEVENVIKNSKLISSSAYKKKAKEGLNHYLIIPDDPEFKRLKDVHTNLSEISYKEDAGKKMGEFTSVTDTPALMKAKENLKLQSESAYKSESKRKLQTDYTLPQEGTSVMQQQLYASTLTSDKTYKDRGDEIKHEPTGYKHMKETMDTKHAKEMNKTHSDIKYKEVAKKGLQHVHPTASDPWTDKAMETNKYISDINYKAKDKDLAHAYKAKETDNFTKHAMNVTNHISDAKYKADYIENVGLCWFRPNERAFEHARKVADLSSVNKYKQEAMKMKGKYHITTDTPEFERLRKVQSTVSESQYKGESGVDQSQDFTVLEITPEIKHATQVSSLVSKNKYKAAFNKDKGTYTALENEPVVQHAQQVQKMQSKVENSREVKKMPKSKFATLANRKDTDHMQQVQRNVSNAEYTKEARENIDKDFTVMESRPDVDHAVKTNKLQSDIHYKQKLKGKNISKTPAMKSAMDANKLQSNLEYRKEFDKEIKGKGWKFIKDTPAQKHAEDIGKVQSQYKYTQKHRNEKMKGYTSITDRPDILHATSCKDVVSDYEYKRRHRNMTGKGYTFTPNTPGQVHAEEATHLQSELQYRRKYGNTGKSWQSEESPSIGHYKEAQKLVDNIDYRKNAKELNARGTGAMESTPAMEHHKKAQQILDGRAYRADYERTVKGRGMTFDLHGTPAMDHIKHAEDIKSDKLYKESYEAMKGRPTLAMDAPGIVSAQKATALISDAKYKQDYNDSRGRMCSVLETPEMKRVRENQRHLSQSNYRSDVEMSRGRNSAVLDTPELRRVRQNTKNTSTVSYKDTNTSRPMNVLDTPAFRTAKQNSMNFSQIKYREDHENMRGKATSVVDTPTLRTVRQNSRNVSDIAYKGALKKTEEMEKMRPNVVQPINKVQKSAKIKFNQTKNTSGLAMKPEPEHEVVRHAPMKRWRRNPGSIFDYDPSEYETDTEYEEGTKRSYSRTNAQTDEDEDFNRLRTIDPKTYVNKTVAWTDYVLGSGHKHVGAPNSVYDYDSRKAQMLNGSNLEKVQYRAMYDYNAADGDEITFVDGDVIIDAQSIDEGWMFGTCLRTGQTGMLPANYVKISA